MSSNWHVSRTSPSRGSHPNKSWISCTNARARTIRRGWPPFASGTYSNSCCASQPMKSGQCRELRRRRRPERPAARSIDARRSSELASPARPLSCRRGGREQPAGIGRFDGRRNDLLEQRIFDHPPPIVFDVRLVRAAGRADCDSRARLRSARAGLRSGRGLVLPRFEQSRAARRLRARRRPRQIAACFQSRATVVKKASRRPSRCDFFFQLEVGAVGRAASSNSLASTPSSVLSR